VLVVIFVYLGNLIFSKIFGEKVLLKKTFCYFVMDFWSFCFFK